MPTNRKLLGAAAFSLALAGGGVAGAVLGTPTLSLAQDTEESTTDSTAAEDAAHHPRFEHRGEGLEAAADAIGISVDDLVAALRDGQSIAQVAEANGVDVQTVIDAMVANGTERLEEAIAELPDRIAELVQREGFPDRPGHGGPGGPGGPFGDRGAGLDAAAEVIGVSPEELREALRDGTSLADLAEANGVDAQDVVDVLVAEATERLDQAVADGRLTEEKAADIAEHLTERITAMVKGERPARPGTAADDTAS